MTYLVWLKEIKLPLKQSIYKIKKIKRKIQVSFW